MRIVCPNCHGGDVAHDYAARMSDGSTGTGTVVNACRSCKGTGWLVHPGKWQAPKPRNER